MRSGYQEQLSALTEQLGVVCGKTGPAMRDATQALLQADLALAESVILGQGEIAAMSAHAEQSAYVLLALQAPVAGDLRAVVSAIQIAADLERMGALATHIAKIARRRHPQHAVPEEVNGYFADMGGLAVAMAGGACDVLSSRDPRRAAEIRHDDDAINELHWQLLTIVIDLGWVHGVTAAVDAVLLGRFYERFADHAVQIARHVIFQATGAYGSATVDRR